MRKKPYLSSHCHSSRRYRVTILSYGKRLYMQGYSLATVACLLPSGPTAPSLKHTASGARFAFHSSKKQNPVRMSRLCDSFAF